LFITSDEEIKDGDWFLTDDKRVEKCAPDWRAREWHKKIILTTDFRLAPDVQKIDDEFLEWFVKNPSYEEVEVEEEDYSQKCRECGETVKRGYSCTKGCFMKSGNFIPTDKNINYKIIIPSEEPTIVRLPTYYESKQETLEEAAENHINNDLDLYESLVDGHISYDIGMDLLHKLFINGAKSQQERSYSEEDMKDYALKCISNYLFGEDFISYNLRIPIVENNNKQFEQYKKNKIWKK